jgi:predicted dehydrogenase
MAGYSRPPVRGQSTTLRSAVVGLGRVGQGYDYDVAGDTVVLTHAAAFAAHPRFDLVAAADPDAEARERFTRKFGVPAVADAADLPEADVVAIATPAALHRAGAEQALRRGVRAIVCEKPLATTTEDGDAIVAACHDTGVPLAVNYMRRFDPAVAELREQLAGGAIGSVRAGVAWYPGGLLENGSHMVDLVDFLLGPIERAEVTAADAESPAARLEAAGVIVHLLPAPTAPLNVFQLELLGTGGSLRYLQSGMTYSFHGTTTPAALPHVEVIDADGEHRRTDLPRYGLHVLDALAARVDGDAPLPSDGDSALRALRVCAALVPLDVRTRA